MTKTREVYVMSLVIRFILVGFSILLDWVLDSSRVKKPRVCFNERGEGPNLAVDSCKRGCLRQEYNNGATQLG
jgi:hypothetical protein